MKQRNPVFKGMMNSGNYKQQVIPDKSKDIEWIETKAESLANYMKELEELEKSVICDKINSINKGKD